MKTDYLQIFVKITQNDWKIVPIKQIIHSTICISKTTNYYIVDRLEKIRRGACGVTDENSDNSTTNNDLGENAEILYQHDSAESSVEGIQSNYLLIKNCC